MKITSTVRQAGPFGMVPRTPSPALWSSCLLQASPHSMQTESATSHSHVCAWRGIIVPGTSVTATSLTPASSWLRSTLKSATSINCAPNATSFTETRSRIWLGGRNGQTDFISLVCSTLGSGRNSKSYRPVQSETVRSLLHSFSPSQAVSYIDLQCPRTSGMCWLADMNMWSQRKRSYRI